ncbi:hypothetical protein SGLAM104S_03383 [Streptomyces glaucescens]
MCSTAETPVVDRGDLIGRAFRFTTGKARNRSRYVRHGIARVERRRRCGTTRQAAWWEAGPRPAWP